MPSGKASKKTAKIKKWVPKKGWVIKKVKNPVAYCCVSTYPPIKCKTCGFYPVYADAYGTYHCPRCNGTQTFGAGMHMQSLIGSGTGRTCPYCKYSPCYIGNILTGTYHCPHCGKDF